MSPPRMSTTTASRASAMAIQVPVLIISDTKKDHGRRIKAYCGGETDMVLVAESHYNHL